MTHLDYGLRFFVARLPHPLVGSFFGSSIESKTPSSSQPILCFYSTLATLSCCLAKRIAKELQTPERRKVLLQMPF